MPGRNNMNEMNVSGFIFTVYLFCFQLANVWANENIIINTNFTVDNLYYEIFKSSRDLIGNTTRELTSKEHEQDLSDTVNIFYGHYDSLSTREKEILKSKVSVLLEKYSELKDLMIHDVRSFLNFLRGKWSYDSLVRLLRVNVDTFRDVSDKLSDVFRPIST